MTVQQGEVRKHDLKKELWEVCEGQDDLNTLS